MKKIVVSIVAVLASMGLALAQQTFKMEVKGGNTITEGETIELDSLALRLVISNTSSEELSLQPVFNTDLVPEDVAIPQFCARQCFGSISDIDPLEIEANGFLGKDEDVHLAIIPLKDYDSVVIGCTFTDTKTNESLNFKVKFVPKKKLRPSNATNWPV